MSPEDLALKRWESSVDVDVGSNADALQTAIGLDDDHRDLGDAVADETVDVPNGAAPVLLVIKVRKPVIFMMLRCILTGGAGVAGGDTEGGNSIRRMSTPSGK